TMGGGGVEIKQRLTGCSRVKNHFFCSLAYVQSLFFLHQEKLAVHRDRCGVSYIDNTHLPSLKEVVSFQLLYRLQFQRGGRREDASDNQPVKGRIHSANLVFFKHVFQQKMGSKLFRFVMLDIIRVWGMSGSYMNGHDINEI